MPRFKSGKPHARLPLILRELADDFRAWPPSRERLLDDLEALLGVILAIALARLARVDHVGWAAFSGYMVMRSHVTQTFRRGLDRILGTAAGAVAACIVVPFLHGDVRICSLSLALGSFISLWFVMSNARSYAWLFAGITFCMVLISGSLEPSQTAHYALSRTLEVGIGTTACVIVSAASTCVLRRRGGTKASANPAVEHREIPLVRRLQYALQGCIAISLIPFFWGWLGSESMQQAATTILAVMTVPPASATVSSGPTSTKLYLRLMGCLLGGLLAAGALLVSHHSPRLMTVILSAGVVIGRHIENGPHRVGYGGTQFVLAFLTVLVPDKYDTAGIGPGLNRLEGIFWGMLMLEPVRILLGLAHIVRGRLRDSSANQG
jgi:uncharacterized membrane protein YccC